MGPREECMVCGDYTGRAGKHEDSLYIFETGPFCEDCYNRMQELTDLFSRPVISEND